MSLTNIKKISAARDYSVALSYLGEVFVWGNNHYYQLGRDSEYIKEPLKIFDNCSDIEAGEGALALVFDDHIKIAGFKHYKEFVSVETLYKPTMLAVGDMHAAFIDQNGEVHSLGGLFSENKKKRSFFFIPPPELKFNKSPAGFFEGRVKFISGKYSYHAVIIDS